MNLFDKIGDAPTGQVPLVESRFCTSNIRLSSALCCLGFSILFDRQPVSVLLDANNDRRVVTFFHSDASSAGFQFTARDVDLWWSWPGKYSIEGYDDALNAIHRVLKERHQLIKVMLNPKPLNGRLHRGSVATTSLHTASVLAACEINLIGYESKSCRWVFAKGAELIADIIKAGGQPKEERPLANDLCIDWMLEALRYHDWLKKMVNSFKPDEKGKWGEAIPTIEMRESGKILQISAGMDKREQRKWIGYL